MHSTWLTAKTDSGTGKFDIQKLIGELIETVEKENESGTYIYYNTVQVLHGTLWASIDYHNMQV